jgi:hypothetical protein
MNKQPLKIFYAGSTDGIRQTDLVLWENLTSYESRFVDTADSLMAEIDAFQPEIIIACYTQSVILTASTFSLLFQEPLRIPIILVLPEAYEDLAIALMDRGATDYFF